MSDRVYHQLREHLAYLKLPALAEQLAQSLQQAQTDKPSYTRFLHDLLAVEIAATEQRRLDGRLSDSRASPRTRRSSSSTSKRSRRWTGASSRSSRRCGSCRRRPTCC